MKLTLPTVFALTMLIAPSVWAQATATKPKQDEKKSGVQVELQDDKTGVDVLLDGKLFTRYDYKTYVKPIFFPIHGPNQLEMTRNYPMKRVTGEQRDHPHHKSMWIGHEVNHLDFWANKSGAIKNRSVGLDAKTNSMTVINDWIKIADQKRVLTESTTYRFGGGDQDETGEYRWLDATVTFSAPHDDVLFNDTKEGMFAIRVHPQLRSKAAPQSGVAKVYGKITNSQGQKGNDCWGQPAKWVHYFGSIDGHETGIAIFDHPNNFRHPTRWHARDYGLFAANPFGLHHFAKSEKGAGEHTLKKGDQMTQRYRVVVDIGQLTPDSIESLYQTFSE